SRGRCPRPECEPSVPRLVPSPPRPYDQSPQATVSVFVDFAIPAPVAPFTLFWLGSGRPLLFRTFAARRIAAHATRRRAALKARIEAAASPGPVAARTAGWSTAAETTARRTTGR